MSEAQEGLDLVSAAGVSPFVHEMQADAGGNDIFQMSVLVPHRVSPDKN